ncbi:lipoxygenase homology domain-containing protein 1-like [Microcebus murinus]|uniref:lipoxygenase homology domain-containing protein 1-like n=1 Tax=Microcebus murinus TaxID=30608 RepID=UPI003F6ADBD1
MPFYIRDLSIHGFWYERRVLEPHPILRDSSIQRKASQRFRVSQDGDWKVIVVTGDLENAGTTATVSLYVYGETGCSGPIILGSGKHQLFSPNSADIFKINLKDIGEIYKIRIGHDNSGKDPGWYLEEVRLENIATHELLCLTVDSWIAENEHDGDLWKEMPIVRTKKAPLPGI